ncbi:MAG: DUF4160 domain-containing protein [Methyloprofundus sp.]|nr:DUF4160 domain-containing protein [Methyloprofundus sp.]
MERLLKLDVPRGTLTKDTIPTRDIIFHAVYGEYVGLFNIETLEMIEGDLPKRAKKLVIEWASINKNELKEMWNSQEFHKLQPLD